jgi:hypothetical protein
MKMDREKLKELLKEEHQHTVSSEEVEAVARMLTVLDNEDKVIGLPSDFSDKVINQILQKQANENRFGWFGYFLGIFCLIICLIVSLAFVDFKIDFGFLKNISAYYGLFLFGAAFIFILHLIEKKVMRFTSE